MLQSPNLTLTTTKDNTKYSKTADSATTQEYSRSIKSDECASNSSKKQLIYLPKAWQPIQLDFTILSLLGTGSYGQVARAKCKRTGRQVAIKLIKDVAKTEYDMIKVLREIQLLRRLTEMDPDGNFVTRLLDVELLQDEDEDENGTGRCDLFIIMEHVDADLRDILDNQSASEFQEDKMIYILYRMLCSLNFIHSANVVHRDIKPANLLISQDLEVKICDFGLSRSLPKPEKESPKSPKSEKKVHKRRLSNHVVSRWYRPPEIILTSKQYNSSVDLWSSGCILSEMITSTAQYQDNELSSEDRILFPGTSCFPLSPCKSGKAKAGEAPMVSTDDQLRLIFEILGDQDQYDFSFIEDNSILDYAMNCQTGTGRIQLPKEFPETTAGVLEILEELLQFNPHFRSDASTLLQNNVFNQIREPSLERPAPYKINLEVDEAGVFDYNTLESLKYSLSDFRKMLENEVCHIKMHISCKNKLK